MSEDITVYRVSRRFLSNLWGQAFGAAKGVLLGWLLFVGLSHLILPVPNELGLSEWLTNPSQAISSLGMSGDRELFRLGFGPGLALLVLLGGLIDNVTWRVVRYELSPNKLALRWRSLLRDVEWDVINQVRVRPNPKPELQSATVTATGRPPILIRGVEESAEFLATLRQRVSQKSSWVEVPTDVDLSLPRTNLILGLLLPIPIYLTWMASYTGRFSTGTIMLFWAWVLVPSAFLMWYWKPGSSRHLCAVEVENSLAAMLLLLSGFLTLLGSLETGTANWWLKYVI